jgi:hypothetical protein
MRLLTGLGRPVRLAVQDVGHLYFRLLTPLHASFPPFLACAGFSTHTIYTSGKRADQWKIST